LPAAARGWQKFDGQKSARTPATAAGRLHLRADRARCVFWPDDWDGTHDEWVLMMGKNTTPENLRRQWAESAERARAAALAEPFWPPPCEKAKNPIPCRSPVNRLYLQASQNLA
jgi:hypothetical protein